MDGLDGLAKSTLAPRSAKSIELLEDDHEKR